MHNLYNAIIIFIGIERTAASESGITYIYGPAVIPSWITRQLPDVEPGHIRDIYDPCLAFLRAQSRIPSGDHMIKRHHNVSYTLQTSVELLVSRSIKKNDIYLFQTSLCKCWLSHGYYTVLRLIWFYCWGWLVGWFILRQISTITAISTEVHSARSSLAVTHPSTNRGRRDLTSVNKPLS